MRSFNIVTSQSRSRVDGMSMCFSFASSSISSPLPKCQVHIFIVWLWFWWFCILKSRKGVLKVSFKLKMFVRQWKIFLWLFLKKLVEITWKCLSENLWENNSWDSFLLRRNGLLEKHPVVLSSCVFPLPRSQVRCSPRKKTQILDSIFAPHGNIE